MFKVIYTVAEGTQTATFKTTDDMRDWYKKSGLADAMKRGEVKYLFFFRAAVNPFGFWVDFHPTWLWD